MNKLSVGDSIRFGWETFKKRPWILVGGFLAAMALSGAFSSILDTTGREPLAPMTVLMFLASLVIGMLIEIGLVTFAIRAHDRVEKVELKDLWNPAPFWRYIGGQILTGIIVIIGIILLIVPGIIAAIGLAFTSYLIVDRGRGPIEALKESWRITKGHKWQLFLLFLAMIGLNILGALALLVGLLVSIPVTMLAFVHAYRTLSGGVSDAVVAEASETITVS